MDQVLTDKGEKEKKELKQKAMLVLERILIVIFFALEIFFVFKPLMELLLMCENYIKNYILYYLIK